MFNFLKNYKKEYEDLKKEYDHLNNILVEKILTTNQLQEENKKLKELNNDIPSLTLKKTQLEQVIDALNEDIDDLKNQQEKLTIEVSELGKNKHNTMKSTKKYEIQLVTMKEFVHSQEEKIEELTNQINNLSNKKTKLESENELLYKQNKLLSNENEQIKFNYESSCATKLSLDNELQMLEQKKMSLITSIDQITIKHSKLLKMIEEKDALYDELTELRADERNIINEVSMQGKNKILLEEQIKELTVKKNVLAAENNELRSKNKEIKESIKSNTIKLEETQKLYKETVMNCPKSNNFYSGIQI